MGNMLDVIIFIGLQASGKSTFYGRRFAQTHRLVSKDSFPHSCDKAKRQIRELADALANGLSVVVDNTNPTEEERALIIAQARGAGARVVGYYFESKIAECLERNGRREGKARVPNVGILGTAKKLTRPNLREGFDELWYVRFEGTDGQIVLLLGGFMKFDNLDARMRAGECFHSLRVPLGMFIVIRVDGRSFSGLTERLADKPFDEKFHRHMVQAAEGLLETLHGIYAYTESDEISVLLPSETTLFDREVEKLVSISAARAAATVSIACGEVVEFDGRIWVGAQQQDVVDYFRWRQSDATRCALNGWCYWTLRKDGKNVREATRALERTSVAQKNELLFSRGINFSRVPAWQRRGTGVYWERYEKDGVNPKTKQPVKAIRRRITVDESLPMKEAYSDFIRQRLQTSAR